MMESMPTPEVGFFAIVMTIQGKSGGNLSEALGNLAAVLRDRKRLQGKIKAMSSEAKASADDHRLAAAGGDGHRLSHHARLHHASCSPRQAGNLMLAGCAGLDGRRHHGDAQDDQLQALGGGTMNDTSMNLLFDKSFLVTAGRRHPGLRHHRDPGHAAMLERDGLDDRLKTVAAPPRGIARQASCRAERQARRAARRADQPT